jgi:hypothetical protein
MKGRKNDFSMTFFVRDPQRNRTQDHQTLYLQYVHDTDKALIWLRDKSIPWDYANIYHRRSREFISRIYNPSSSNIAESHINQKNYGNSIQCTANDQSPG